MDYVFQQTLSLSLALTPQANMRVVEFERSGWDVRTWLGEAHFVGTLERLDESYALLSELLELPSPLSPSHFNAAVRRGVTEQAVEELRSQYDELRYDPQLSYFIGLEHETYRTAASVLDRRLSRRSARKLSR